MNDDVNLKKIQLISKQLEEKENDLLCAAEIGKELLETNTKLENRIYELETEVRTINENVEQLSYQLNQKNDLIAILTSDDESVTPTNSKSINAELMVRRVVMLEEENKNLRSEICEVVSQTDEAEKQEKEMIEELNKQLKNKSQQLESLTYELERYKEENRLQYEEIVNLTKRCQEAEMSLHSLMTENDETSSMLTITKENQDLLAIELTEFKKRYAETYTLLLETQEMLKKHMKKFTPCVRSSILPGGSINSYNNLFANDSLQSELNHHSLDSGILSDAGNSNGKYCKDVNDAMKFVQNSSFQQNNTSTIMSSSTSYYSATREGTPNPFCSTIYGNLSNTFDIKPFESKIEPPEINNKKLGEMGVPGAKDLEEALSRLSIADIESSRRAMLTYEPNATFYDEPPLCRTPESIMSTLSNISTTRWSMPKKLEIVKPLEGSHTLNQWKGLATPTFGGLLQDNAHVKVRGERRLDELGVRMYTLNDVEEDVEDFPLGKQFESSAYTYTYTNSRVLHPDDGSSVSFSLPPSQISSQLNSNVGSRQTTAPPTPRHSLSRRNSCSTFSINLGLASVLNERGIKAVTPSCLSTPTGQNFSPTVTPCNSPEGSPTRPLSPETVGASQIRNKSALLHLEKKALKSLKLLEKVEHFGIDNVMATPASSSSCRISPLALYSSNIYTHRSSPMAQLTSLKYLTDKRNSDDNLMSRTKETENFASTNASNSNIHSNEARKSRRVQRQKSRHKMSRPDLGTVNIRSAEAAKAGRSNAEEAQEGEKGLVGEFVGTISSLLFGRKGGLY